MKHTVLIVDDELANLQKLRRTLMDEYRVLSSANAQEALSTLSKETISAIITDQRMPGMTGVELLEQALRLQPAAMRIVLTGYTEVEDLIDSINNGKVYKYITKPWEPDRLRADLREAIRHHELLVENERLQRELKEANSRLLNENELLRQEIDREQSMEQIVFRSEAMRHILELLEKVTPTDSTVLIQGETGTGKELLARSIHRRSPRNRGIFIAVNCGAIPNDLIESEFFGHLRGSFTSATADKKGYFEIANGGTILLDEIGEASMDLQVKLLRVLQEGEIMPVGASRPRRVDVRVLASTNRDLRAEVSAGRFRQDLYYRLHVFSILIPPLRERPEDIPVLAEFFLHSLNQRLRKQIQPLPEDILRLLARYDWPGNVRELRNEIERLVILAGTRDQVYSAMLSDHVRVAAGREPSPGGTRLKAAMEELERRLISEALAAHQQNRSRAARNLGISRQSLLEKMGRYGLS